MLFELPSRTFTVILMESYNKASSTMYCVTVCRSQSEFVLSLAIVTSYFCGGSPFHENSTLPSINFVEKVRDPPEKKNYLK